MSLFVKQVLQKSHPNCSILADSTPIWNEECICPHPDGLKLPDANKLYNIIYYVYVNSTAML